MRRRRGVLVRIFRPTFFASPLTALAGAGEKCGAENESSPRHFEQLGNASENLLPKTHQIQPATQNPEESCEFLSSKMSRTCDERWRSTFARKVTPSMRRRTAKRGSSRRSPG